MTTLDTAKDTQKTSVKMGEDMSKQQLVHNEQQLVYKIDLTDTKIVDAEGNFLCPRCGVNISPDDVTMETYSILETRSKNGALKEIILSCMCGIPIHLVGYQLLEVLEIAC